RAPAVDAAAHAPDPIPSPNSFQGASVRNPSPRPTAPPAPLTARPLVTPPPREQASPPVQSSFIPQPAGSSLFDSVNKIPGDTLLKMRAHSAPCTRCKLRKGLKTTVFADGSPKTQLDFVGEAPPALQHAQPLPFPSRATH